MTGSDKEEGHFGSAYSLQSSDETITHYKNWAETYDQEVGEENDYAQPRRCADALTSILSPDNARILDAGCGTGLSGVALRSKGYKHIDGCDFSPDMLTRAREKEVYRHLFGADLNKGLQDVADHQYDAVTAVGVFSFGHVLPAACDELLRAIRPGGALIIGLNDKYWDEGALSAKIDELKRNKVVTEVAREHGEHLPGHQVMGWVLSLVRN